MAAQTTTCPPLGDRVTKSLLGYGVIAGLFYVLVVVVQAATRVGFNPARHDASLLANGHLGWIQIANFVVTGAMTIAAAVGIGRALGAGAGRWAAWLIGAYGAALVGAGIFPADPSLGFPAGTPDGRGPVSWHGMLHLMCAGAGFSCFIAACFVMAARFSRAGELRWAWYSRLSGAVFAAGFAAIATGFNSVAIISGFTAALLLAWTWLAAVSIKLYRRV